MRSPFLLFAAIGLMASDLVAQQPPRSAPFAFAAGPAWSGQLTGLQIRAEYRLLRDRWLGFRVDAGARWTPTQSLAAPSVLYGDGGRYEGIAQATDLHLSIAAVFAPWPSGRISPYFLTGAAAVQSWSTDRGAYRYADGSLAQAVPGRSWTRGDVVLVTGFGLRLRLGDHPIQLEVQRYGPTRALTLGTTLRF
jgi:hypothetical protein